MLTNVNKFIEEVTFGEIALHDLKNNAVIFGSARTSPEHKDYIFALQLARAVSVLGFNVITGGGPGIMEAANRGAQQGRSGKSIGLNIDLPNEDFTNNYQDISLQFHSFFSRKHMFFRDTDIYFIIPGGDGTMDELYEARTLMATGKIKIAPIVLCNTDYWDPLDAWMRHTQVISGTVDAKSFNNMRLVDTVRDAVGALPEYVNKIEDEIFANTDDWESGKYGRDSKYVRVSDNDRS